MSMLRYAQPCRFRTGKKDNNYFSLVEPAQLDIFFLRFKFMQITEDLLFIVHDPRFFTGFMKQLHKLCIFRAVNLIAVTKFPDVTSL